MLFPLQDLHAEIHSLLEIIYRVQKYALHVISGAKPLAGAGEDDDSDLVILVSLVYSALQFPMRVIDRWYSARP